MTAFGIVAPKTGAPEDSPNVISPAIVGVIDDVGADRSGVRRGYQMIDSAEITNFRAFEKTALSGLQRINLIVGDNGAGKTSLLEALFAATATSAEVAMRLRAWRGMDGIQTQSFYENVFASLFRNFDGKNTISISLKGSVSDTRSVRCFYDTEEQAQLTLVPGGNAVLNKSRPVVFEYVDASGKPSRSVAQIQANGSISIPAAGLRDTDTSFLAARAPFNVAENAQWFSELSKAGRDSQLVLSMRDQFPNIDSMSIEIEAGVHSIFVKLKSMQRKIAAGYVSDGLNKLITVLLHVAHAARTATFIDELENGLHFSRYDKLWPQLLKSAESFDTQIFATTHSFEFIKSVVPMMKEHPDKFTIIRVFQVDGKSDARVLEGKKALALIESGLELRE